MSICTLRMKPLTEAKSDKAEKAYRYFRRTVKNTVPEKTNSRSNPAVILHSTMYGLYIMNKNK